MKNKERDDGVKAPKDCQKKTNEGLVPWSLPKTINAMQSCAVCRTDIRGFPQEKNEFVKSLSYGWPLMQGTNINNGERTMKNTNSSSSSYEWLETITKAKQGDPSSVLMIAHARLNRVLPACDEGVAAQIIPLIKSNKKLFWAFILLKSEYAQKTSARNNASDLLEAALLAGDKVVGRLFTFIAKNSGHRASALDIAVGFMGRKSLCRVA